MSSAGNKSCTARKETAPHEEGAKRVGDIHIVVSDTGRVSELQLYEGNVYSLETPGDHENGYEQGGFIAASELPGMVDRLRHVLVTGGVELTHTTCLGLAILAFNSVPGVWEDQFNAHNFLRAVLGFTPRAFGPGMTRSFSPDGYSQSDIMTSEGRGRRAEEQYYRAKEKKHEVTAREGGDAAAKGTQ